MPDELVPDDATIPSDAVVWRRAAPDQLVMEAGNPPTRRISSGAFCDSSDSCMSVHLPHPGESVGEFLVGFEGFAVAELKVGDLRASGFGVIRALQHGPQHCEVTGKKSNGRQRKKLAALARPLYIPPPDPTK